MAVLPVLRRESVPAGHARHWVLPTASPVALYVLAGHAACAHAKCLEQYQTETDYECRWGKAINVRAQAVPLPALNEPAAQADRGPAAIEWRDGSVSTWQGRTSRGASVRARTYRHRPTRPCCHPQGRCPCRRGSSCRTRCRSCCRCWAGRLCTRRRSPTDRTYTRDDHGRSVRRARADAAGRCDRRARGRTVAAAASHAVVASGALCRV